MRIRNRFTDGDISDYLNPTFITLTRFVLILCPLLCNLSSLTLYKVYSPTQRTILSFPDLQLNLWQS